MRIVGQPVYDKKGNLTNFFAIEEDITERKLNDEKLTYSEEKYRSIIENMELGLLEVDNEGIIVRPYQRFCELTGYTIEELIGKNAIEMLVPRAYWTIFEQQTHDRQEGKAGMYEVPIIHKNGDTVWVLISGAPIYNERGEIKGSIGIHYNLTERKAIEEKLANAKKAAENARETEQLFLANMSHEIRTPLNAIIGMSHLLYDTRPSSEQRDYIDILNTSANFLHALISNILDMAKIEAGKIEINPQPFDLVGLICTLQKTFQLKMEGRDVEVEAMIDARIKGMYIGNETLLQQILMNLLGNADKFTESGTIGIKVKLLKNEDTQTWIEFQIYDTGIGIDENQLDLIFDKFKQIQDAKGQKYKGTGLGLSIVKELIDIQGGTIVVKSKKGLGTTFTFVLPFVPSDKEVVEVKSISASNETVDYSNSKLLVVEDNIMNRKYIGTLLDKRNIKFEVAVDGLVEVRKANTNTYDLILMDIQMPNMNGYEATLNIRNTANPNKHTPIIALTVSAMLDQKNKAYEVGMNDYIAKPYTPQELFDKLALYLHEVPAHAQSTTEPQKPTVIYQKALNVPYLKELYAEDYAYAYAIFESFWADMMPIFDTLLPLAQNGEVKKIGALTHQLKSTTALIGLPQVEVLLMKFESWIHKNESISDEILISKVKEIIQAFEDKKEAVHTQMKTFQRLAESNE